MHEFAGNLNARIGQKADTISEIENTEPRDVFDKKIPITAKSYSIFSLKQELDLAIEE